MFARHLCPLPATLAFVVVSALGAASPPAHAASLAEARPATPPATTETASAPERARLLDEVVETISKHFADVEKLKAIGWSARAAALRPAIMAAPSTADAVRIIQGLVGELKTSHTALFTPDDLEYFILLDVVPPRSDPDKLVERKFWGARVHYPGIGAFTRDVDGRHFVDGVMEGSPADRAGLKYGDEILTVDGQPYSPIAAFRSKAAHTVELRIRRSAEGATEALRVDVVNINPSEAFAMATRASARLIERDGKRIGYIHLWSIRDEEPARSAIAIVRRLSREHVAQGQPKASPGPPLEFLIVDARGKVGGNSGTARAILEAIAAPAGNALGRLSFQNRDAGPRREHHHAHTERFEPGFAGRTILLTDHHTRSAGDLLAAGFRNSKLGQIIGTPTAGALMGGATFVMPGDLVLYVAVSKVEIDGETLEGRGVAPDIRIERTLPYAGGADPVLDAAIAKAADQSRPQ